MLRSSRLFAAVATSALLSACSSDVHGLFDPLGSGLETPVALETSTDAASSEVSRVVFATTPGEVSTTWDVTSSPCLDATATAVRSGSVVEVRIHRSASPLALCVAMEVSYHYVAHVPLAPGAYEVRLVDDLLGQQLRPVGRSTIVVTP